MIRKLAVFLTAFFVTTQAWAIDTILSIPLDSTSVVLPCITLLDISASPEGAVAATGITQAEAGLQIKVRADVTNGWHAEHVTATINAITGVIGKFETPDANDVHFEEVATSAGCYQLILPDSYYTLDDGGTGCGGAACDAKEITILIRDTTTPAFADTWVRVALNVTDSDTLVNLIWNEPSSGHTTAGTSGAGIYTDVPAIAIDTATSIPAQITTATTAASRNFVYQAGITAVTSQTAFQVVAGDDPGADNFHTNRWLCIEDTDDEDAQDCARITSFTSSTNEWVIANALDFTVAIGDTIFIRAPSNDFLGTDEITAAVIAANAIGASEIATDAITSSKIAVDAIGASQIAANAIGVSEIATDAIGAAEIATDAIGSAELATDAITAAQISAGAIGASEIATDAIGANEFAADAVDEIWDDVVETAGATYTGRCLLAAIGAYVAGEFATVGNTTTYQDTNGTTTRIVGTVTAGGRGTMSITCP